MELVNLRRQDIPYVEGELISSSYLERDQIEQLARDVSKHANFSPGQDCHEVTELVNHYGGKVHYFHYADWIDEDGSLFVNAPYDFDIAICRHTSPIKDRYSIAHELGHYFLHSQQGDIPLIATRKDQDGIDYEANAFAMELLMPEERFLKSLKENGEDLLNICSEFMLPYDYKLLKFRRDYLIEKNK